MTRREFDKLTKETWGKGSMASDERRSYRARRMITTGDDYIARRAARMAYLRSVRYPHEPVLATLGIGSPFRAVAVLRRALKSPMLAGRD